MLDLKIYYYHTKEPTIYDVVSFMELIKLAHCEIQVEEMPNTPEPVFSVSFSEQPYFIVKGKDAGAFCAILILR